MREQNYLEYLIQIIMQCNFLCLIELLINFLCSINKHEHLLLRLLRMSTVVGYNKIITCICVSVVLNLQTLFKKIFKCT